MNSISPPSRRRFIANTAAISIAGMAATSCAVQTSKRDAQTIVLGAGLSGLYAARLLAEAGQDVLVLEGSQRVGGRLHTLDLGKDGLSEGGGEQIGAGYARLRQTASALGVEIKPDSHPSIATSLHHGGRLMHGRDWKNAPENPFSGRARLGGPDSALFRLAAGENPLGNISDWYGAPGKTVDMSAKDWLTKRGIAPNAIKTIDHTINANSVDTYSMLNLFRSLALYNQERTLGQSGYAKGGASAIPLAIAKALPRPVKTSQRIAAIRVTKKDAEIETEDGTVWRADHIIAALPFAALKTIAITAPLTDLQRSAMRQMPYTQILQIHFRSETAFWEQDGFGPSMSTDSPLERIFARKGPDGSPDGVFRAWINGENARTLNALTDDDLFKLCQSEMGRLRPASQGKVKGLKIVRWTDTNPLAGGAYMHFAPQQSGVWHGNIGAPAGRLSFAGEHLSSLHTGMEGAMESAEAAAFALL